MKCFSGQSLTEQGEKMEMKRFKTWILFNHSPAIDKARSTGYSSHSSVKMYNTFKNSKTGT